MFRRARMTGSTNHETETIEVSAVTSPARSSLTPVSNGLTSQGSYSQILLIRA